jgi:acyl-CoA thioester hydrolase
VNLIQTRLTLPVRPNDLDALGHVNNAVALEYLEAGRWDWLGRHGLVHTDRVIAVVARTEIDYRAEIPRGQVEVRTMLESPSAAEFEEDGITFRAVFRQHVHLLPGGPGADTPRPADSPAVEATVSVAFLDAAERCLVTLQDFLVAAARHDSR